MDLAEGFDELFANIVALEEGLVDAIGKAEREGMYPEADGD